MVGARVVVAVAVADAVAEEEAEAVDEDEAEEVAVAEDIDDRVELVVAVGTAVDAADIVGMAALVFDSE